MKGINLKISSKYFKKILLFVFRLRLLKRSPSTYYPSLIEVSDSGCLLAAPLL